MVFKYTFVLLFASAINCGTIRQNVQQFQSVPVVNAPVERFFQVPVTQPIVKTIPTAFLNQEFNGFPVPKTIPESLLTLGRADLVFGQSIPAELLTFTAPGVNSFSQPLLSQIDVRNVVPEVRAPLISPAQKILSQPTPLEATNQNEVPVNEPRAETPETPVAPVLNENAPVAQSGLNSGFQSFSSGFTAQNRPQFNFGSNFAPNLREVSQITENIPKVETNARVEQLPERVQQTVEQRVESQEPQPAPQFNAELNVPEQKIEQRIETSIPRQQENQQIVEQVTQQRIDAIPQQNIFTNSGRPFPITESRIPASLLSSYSF